MFNKTITVLIPTYNRRYFIIESLRSIFEQTYKKIKVLIYDDGSIDNTEQIVKSTFATKQIKYIYSPINKGVSYARNQLLDMCKTDIACWQDSDDVSNINSLILLSSNT